MKQKIAHAGKLMAWILAGGVAALFPSVFAALPENPGPSAYEQHLQENRIKVEKLMREKKIQNEDVVSFAVTPVSDLMRLADVFPEDGQLNSPVMITLAGTEFEPGSFQLYALKDLKNVVLKTSDLKSEEGDVIPKENLDLKVVKIWYQNGNRWTSYFADVGLALCPELLLNDEDMILVDTKNPANYARIQTEDGTRYEWISAPFELETGTFDPMQKGFQDADELQPVDLKAGEFKQFFLTVHVPAGQKGGIYSGFVEVAASDGKLLTEIPVRVRVLPFDLPMPKAYRELDRPFLSSMMGGGSSMEEMLRIYGGDRELAEKMLREHYRNLKEHNLFYPFFPQTPEMFTWMREMGFPLDTVFGKNFLPWFGRNSGGRLTFDNYMTAKKAARRTHDFYMENLGHSNIIAMYGDEPGAAFVTTHRGFNKYYMEYGIKFGTSGHDVLFYKQAYVQNI